MLTGAEVEKVEESEEPILATGRACVNKEDRSGRVREGRAERAMNIRWAGKARGTTDGNAGRSICSQRRSRMSKQFKTRSVRPPQILKEIGMTP